MSKTNKRTKRPTKVPKKFLYVRHECPVKNDPGPGSDGIAEFFFGAIISAIGFLIAYGLANVCN